MINDSQTGELCARLHAALAAETTPPIGLEKLEVALFDQPDKCDPLNTRAIMSARACRDGIDCGWIAETAIGQSRSPDHDAIVERLIQGLALEIREKPDQRLSYGSDPMPCRVV